MRQSENVKQIRLTDNHILTYDKYQFVLKTRVAKKGDEIKAGKYKGQLVKEDNYMDTYFPNIKILCDHVLMDEFKIVFELYDMKEIGDKFDQLIKNPHINRLNIASEWFQTIKKW
jgi:hypothetical protein